MTRCRAHPVLLSALLGLAILSRPAWAAEADAKTATATKKAEAPKEKEKEAEDTSKSRRATLTDKIAPVSGNLFLKKSRVELSPSVGMSLGDAFFQKYVFGLKLAYHFAETLSVGLHGAYALNAPSGSVSVCNSAGCEQPTLDRLKKLPGQVTLLAGLDLAWAPLYGKVNVLAEKVLHFDTAIYLGPSAVQYQLDGASYFAPAGHVGLGQRFFLSPNVTLRLDVSDTIYSAQVQLGDSTSKIENQFLFELGISFFLGSGPKE